MKNLFWHYLSEVNYETNSEENFTMISMNFVRDLEEMAHSSLKAKGYSDKDLAKFSDNLLLAYFKDEQLSITARPRRVVYSKQFTCPEDYKEALKEFVNKVENGEDLTRFMSERVRTKYNNNDALLNDWGIYHFHLTRRFRKDSTAKRSIYQIFACCDENTIYFLQVYPHATENLYSLKELLCIVKEQLASFTAKIR